MSRVIVIPARYGSSRLPGKPLATIAGRSLIERVWRIAMAASNVDRVLVATDDERIVEEVTRFGGEAVMTSPECRNGTERVHEAISSLESEPEIVVNLQGDAPLTPPWVLEAVIDELEREPSAGIATPAVHLPREQIEAVRQSKRLGAPAGTLVTFDRERWALYFSKAMIPFLRFEEEGDLPVYKHIGIYGFRLPTLRRYLELEPTPLEQVEGLEQLRALEHGIRIKIALVDYRGRTPWSVDSAEDVEMVETILAREGDPEATRRDETDPTGEGEPA